MGNEVAATGGAIGTAATGIAVGVTGGKVKSINNACKHCAEYTGDQFMQSSLRHGGETVGRAMVTVTAYSASKYYGGNDEEWNKCYYQQKAQTAESGGKFVKKSKENLNGITNGTPVVGHAKGAIHYIRGEREEGDVAMKAASRTVGVALGGIGGFFVIGPVGAFIGGIAGGGALDGITTGVESKIHGRFMPNGLILEYFNALNASSGKERVGPIINLTTGLLFDGLTGYAAAQIVEQLLENNQTLYRNMPLEEAESSIRQQKVIQGHNQGGAMGETWATESMKHAQKFLEQKSAAHPHLNYKTVEYKVVKQMYEKQMKNPAINQACSRVINQQRLASGQSLFNLFNKEKIGNGAVNIGIKGSKNLALLNKAVVSVKELNFTSLKFQTSAYHNFVKIGQGAGSILAPQLKASKSKIKEVN